jgi:hypothetical protein
VLIAGGEDAKNRGPRSNIVDFWNSNTNQVERSGSNLTTEVRNLAGCNVAGIYAMFGGGVPLSNWINIYNSTSDAWLPVKTLSVARSNLVATGVGVYGLFAGGISIFSTPNTYNDNVEIWNSITDTISTSALSVARADLTATSVGTYALFAGGNQYYMISPI